MSDLAILISVYHPYRWVAPFTHQLIERYWPEHPPLYFCGLTAEEAGSLPHIPCPQAELPRVWAEFVLDAARRLQAQGHTKIYFLLEDHPPLGVCHHRHLSETLPGLLDAWNASYIGLMGWDNRRFINTSPILDEAHYRMAHLTGEKAPRFHLHPSLFRTEALIACLELLLRRDKPNPWGFEKLCDKPDADLPEAFKQGCYQICGETLALEIPGRTEQWLRRGERFFYHRAMSLFPPLHRIGLGMRYWDWLGFDDFFYNGPFPMFYSGVMARARVNPFFVRYVEKHHADDPDYHALLQTAQQEAP